MQKEYQKEIFKKLTENPSLQSERQTFEKLFGKTVWNIIPSEKCDLKIKDLSECEHVLKQKAGKPPCIGDLKNAVSSARKTKSPKIVQCQKGLWAIVIPLVQGDTFYGYILICHIKKKPEQETAFVLQSFALAILREVQKELELSKLYESIRPRAIALSTVHTVHRLISSTLDIDELLPRVARLSLQVMRAQRASIYLLDEKKENLIQKAAIDTRTEKPLKLSKMRIGKGVEGKVAKDGNAVLTNKFLSVPLVHEEIIGVITVADKIENKPFTSLDKEILSTLAEQAVIAIHNAKLYEEQEKVTIGSIKSLAALLDTKSPYTYTHSQAFVRIVLAIAQELHMNDEDLRALHHAALLPDAGKISVPEEILGKPSKLTTEEYRLIKEHPLKGAQILKHIDVLKPTIPIILHHHERFDGKGYPGGLKADQIPLGSRIMAVADAFEAMIYKRPYRKAMSFQSAVNEIKKYSGTQFDPEIVNAFLKLVDSGKIKDILKQESESER